MVEELFKAVEEFFKAHQYTIAAIAAAGTVAAVVTSLVLAWSTRRADRTRLKAQADFWLIFDKSIDRKDHRFLEVRITNKGKWPLRISGNFFYWKTPFTREYMMVSPLDLTGSSLIRQKHYPIQISARASETFTISDLSTLEQEVKRMRVANTFANRLRFRFIKAFVQTDDGGTFRVKLSPGVRKVWSEQT